MSDNKITKAEIEQERQTRIQECAKQINEILEAHDCALVATPRLEKGRIVADVQMVSKT